MTLYWPFFPPFWGVDFYVISLNCQPQLKIRHLTIQSDISYFTTIANRHGAINDSKQNRRGRWQLCLIHQRKQDCRSILFLTTDQRRQRTETSTDTSHDSRQKATQTTAKIRSSQIHTNWKKTWKRTCPIIRKSQDSRSTRLRCLEKYNWGAHTINCLTEAVNNPNLLG